MLNPKLDAQLKAITKFPIVIIGTPRTGSTALLNYIKTCYPELTVYDDVDTLDKTSVVELNHADNFVIKFQPHKIDNYSIELLDRLLGPNTFKIKTKRHSSVDQAASVYLANARLRWKYSPNDVNDLMFLDAPVVLENAEHAAEHHNTCLQINAAVEQQFNIQYDLELFGDDLITLANDISIVTTPKPSNYDEIKQAISTAFMDAGSFPKVGIRLDGDRYQFIQL
jgi:hypothetical protein